MNDGKFKPIKIYLSPSIAPVYIQTCIHSTTKVEDVISFYNFATGTLLDELSTLIKSSNGSSTWRPLITYKNILRAIENIGTEMSLGLRSFSYLIISAN